MQALRTIAVIWQPFSPWWTEIFACHLVANLWASFLSPVKLRQNCLPCRFVVWLEWDNTEKAPIEGFVFHKCSFPYCPLNSTFTPYCLSKIHSLPCHFSDGKHSEFHIIDRIKGNAPSMESSVNHNSVSDWPSATQSTFLSRPHATFLCLLKPALPRDSAYS